MRLLFSICSFPRYITGITLVHAQQPHLRACFNVSRTANLARAFIADTKTIPALGNTITSKYPPVSQRGTVLRAQHQAQTPQHTAHRRRAEDLTFLHRAAHRAQWAKKRAQEVWVVMMSIRQTEVVALGYVPQESSS
jgi:hypothetical protein